MSDNQLEPFEEWARNAVPQFSAAGKYVRDGKWSYNHNIVELMWQCWQAALTRSKQTEPVGDEAIKHMANRFLGWRLPDNFHPDGGISFDPVGNKGSRHEYRHNPIGTNLLDATQAEAMVRYMIEGLPK